jgi:hypothetical protein
MPVVSPKPISRRRLGELLGEAEDLVHRDLALVRAAERGGDHGAEGEVLGDDALAHHLTSAIVSRPSG